MNPEMFYQALKAFGIKLSDQQKAQFETYYRYLVATNQHVNLTSITEKSAVYLKHFYDSITPAHYFEPLRHHHLSMCDVGAGAGFPSIPLKIAFPQLQVTIIDALNKRITFLRNLIQRLGLTGVKVYHSRAETFGSLKSSHREQFDLVIARAVAPLNILSEFCLPLVKVGGRMLAMKALDVKEELKASHTAIQILGGRIDKVNTFKLPVSSDLRSIVVIKKQKRTPAKYPRRPGVPKRRPLVK